MGIKLPEPEGQQRDVVYLRERGHCVVLGTAGSGKTTMAVHRAWYLSNAPRFGGPTLLVTFNRTLVTYLKSLVCEDANLKIETYHRFALGYLSCQSGERIRVCQNKRQLVNRAIVEVGDRFGFARAVFNRSVDFFLDELHWLAGHGIVDPQDYVSGRMQRVGRLSPLSQPDRAVVYEIYQCYRKLRFEQGHFYDWDDLPSAVLRAFRSDGEPRRYRHVVVDEGQDFTPEMIRSLAAAIPDDGSLTFFGDYAQQIYGSRMSWRSLGLNVMGKNKVEFAQNYRNTRQIAWLAQAVSNMPHFRDGVDIVEPRAPAADGAKPALVQVSSKDEQIATAARFANNLSEDRRVAVLMRTRHYEDQLRRHLDSRRHIRKLHRDLKKWHLGKGIFYGTYPSAKGLEFDVVILPFCDDDELPSTEEVGTFGMEEAKARESRKLYVAVTRARVDLVLLCSGQLTTLLPDEALGLYERL